MKTEDWCDIEDGGIMAINKVALFKRNLSFININNEKDKIGDVLGNLAVVLLKTVPILYHLMNNVKMAFPQQGKTRCGM